MKIRYYIFLLIATFTGCTSDVQDIDEHGHVDEIAYEEPDHDGEHIDPDDHALSDEHSAVESSEWQDIMPIQTAPVQLRTLYVTHALPGTIISEPDRNAVVGTVINASINQVFVNVGDHVEKGAVLACLTSPDISLLRAEYDRAEAELTILTQAFERSERLFGEEIIPARSYQEALSDLKIAQVTRDYAYQRLKAVGLSDNEIASNAPCPHENVTTSIHLRAPIAGFITTRDVVVGESVDASHQLFHIVDLDTVWLEAEIFEKDLVDVHIGNRVFVEVAAYDTVFSGTVFSIGNTVEETARTVQLHAVLDNPGVLLKPGMYASAEVVVGVRENVRVVPREAVFVQDGIHTVFVLEGQDYHRHTVEVGIEQDGFIEIASGLEPDDMVVTTGNYQLASQSLMDSIDPHAGHNH